MKPKITEPGVLDGWAGLHPAFAPLVSQTRISRLTVASWLGVHCGSPGRLDVDASLGEKPHGQILLRYGLELSWLCALPQLSTAAAALLAARIAGLFAAQPPVSGRNMLVPNLFTALSASTPDNTLVVEAARLLSCSHSGGPELTSRDIGCVEALWPLALPTECLLASGGDDRLTLGAQTGHNRYGCTPWPRPEIISFSSCTASNISVPAFAAADLARRSLIAEALRTAPSVALAAASDMISAAILDHFHVADLAEAVLAASGTDAALVVTGLLAAEHPSEILTSILMSPSETGSGVPDAVQGRHFASSAAAGCKVGKGQPIDGLPLGPRLVTVALRDELGDPRAQSAVTSDCITAIHAGLGQGRVVLHAIDGSKTGLTAPDRASCSRLAAAYGERLDIVVDACQARIEPELIRWYLQQGFPVLVTGSKFFAAPGFCGAVLFPRSRLQNIAKHGRLPAGLAPYARLDGGFGSRRCPGLVLRWCAALHHMSEFARIPADEIACRLLRSSRSLVAAMAPHARLRLIPAPRPEGMGWSDQRSVFTFALQGTQQMVSFADLRPIYQALNADAMSYTASDSGEHTNLFQIGQPVELASHQQSGGLRIAMSAAQIVEDEDCRGHFAAIFAKLVVLLQRAPAAAPVLQANSADSAGMSRVLLTG